MPTLTRRDRLLLRLGSRSLRESVPSPAGAGVDPDEALYRRLTGRSTADLTAWEQSRALAVAQYLDRRNPLAHRILDIITDHLFAAGLHIATRNAQVEEFLEAHWSDPINRWDERAPRWFRLLLRDGELVAPAGVNDASGVVRWGTIPADQIKDVRVDPGNWEITTQVVLVPETPGGDDRTLDVIRHDLGTGRLAGEAGYWRWGDDGTRGVSLLFPLADLVDLLETSMWTDAEREMLQKSFVWDVTMTGADEAQIQAALKTERMKPPAPGSVRVHNDREVWQAVSPDLRAADSVTGQHFRLTFLLGSVGIPEHWFGSGGDVNRAVGTVMDDPTILMMQRLQARAFGMVTDCLRYAVDQAVLHHTLPALVDVEDDHGDPTGEQVDPRDCFTVEANAEMNVADVQAAAASLQQIAAALTSATGQDWVTEGTARRAFLAVLSQVGVDVDPDAEADAIQAEREQQQAAPTVPPDVAAMYAQAVARAGQGGQFGQPGQAPNGQQAVPVPGGNGARP